jgi:hypothetical protein
MIAIGMSNILGCSFASSFPVTAGSFCRSSVNAASGVRTPFGGFYTGILNLYNEGEYSVGNKNGFYSAASSRPVGYHGLDTLLLVHSKELFSCCHRLLHHFYGRSSFSQVGLEIEE